MNATGTYFMRFVSTEESEREGYRPMNLVLKVKGNRFTLFLKNLDNQFVSDSTLYSTHQEALRVMRDVGAVLNPKTMTCTTNVYFD